MRHTDVVIGNIYQHHMDGKGWTVKISGIFEDRQRWGWEGTLSGIQAKVEDSSKCWGWCDELRQIECICADGFGLNLRCPIHKPKGD